MEAQRFGSNGGNDIHFSLLLIANIRISLVCGCFEFIDFGDGEFVVGRFVPVERIGFMKHKSKLFNFVQSGRGSISTRRMKG